uniref:Uncharacterized protein n=1 Tax=Octopus bimaculoides TaxID=37653 RepID=A0A0L8HT32_OCTBM
MKNVAPVLKKIQSNLCGRPNRKIRHFIHFFFSSIKRWKKSSSNRRKSNLVKGKLVPHKLSESFPLLRMVCEKEKKVMFAGDSSEHSSEFEPQDILDFLTDSKNFDVSLSESFTPEKTAYIASADPLAKRFYQLMCIRDNVRPLPIILNNLEKKKFELHQYSIYIRMFEIFMETLKNNRRVEVLELIENQIDNERAILIAKMLQKNITIFSLNLSRNCIGMEGISALSDVLDSSYSVTCLYLSGK